MNQRKRIFFFLIWAVVILIAPSPKSVVSCKNNIDKKMLVKNRKACKNEKTTSQCNVQWHFPTGQEAIPTKVSTDQYLQHRKSLNQEKKWQGLGFLDQWFDQWNNWWCFQLAKVNILKNKIRSQYEEIKI